MIEYDPRGGRPMVETISKQEYLARWAYGEIESKRFSAYYPIDRKYHQIRGKAKSKIPFNALNQAERKLLVEMIENSFRAQPNGGLLAYFNDVVALEAKLVDANFLLDCFVVGGLRKFCAVTGTVREYCKPIETGTAAVLSDADVRKHVASSNVEPDFTPTDVCLVRQGNAWVLVEGTYRTLMFLRSDTANRKISVWVPLETMSLTSTTPVAGTAFTTNSS
uniref:Uncharacterized protein n=1 Tax=Rhodopseudomonas palustris (strain BisA53) TaxID=316055 RepID=Q07NQ5_RHOP5